MLMTNSFKFSYSYVVAMKVISISLAYCDDNFLLVEAIVWIS